MNIGLCGLGKAGQEFVKYILKSDEFILRQVLCREQSKTAGKNVSEVTGLLTYSEIPITKISEFRNIKNLDVIIVDFSNSITSLNLLDICAKFKVNLVICTTNFSEYQLNFIEKMANVYDIGVVYAPTLTIGINILLKFVKNLSILFPEFSFTIIEKHGKNKDCPTRTAKIISNNIDKEDTKILSVRLNGYVGIHEVIATDGYERITIEHESFSRSAFVRGSLIASKFIYKRKGFFTMKDVMENLMLR